MKAPEDRLGRKICIGDWVAFPGRAGSSLWITVMKVTEVHVKKKERWGHEREEIILLGTTTEGRATRTGRVDRVVILDNPEK